MDNKYNRGSEWRKWDLHVHTPKSIYNRFGADTDETWGKYILDLESLSDDFAVIGVNDYMFLDGYEILRKEQVNNGRLKGLKLFPVIEFRIEKFAGVQFGNLKRINLHVIFSDDVTVETIKSQFLNTLEQSYYLETGEKWTRAITYESVSELGKEIKASVPEDELRNYDSDLIEGFNNLNVKEDQIFKSLEKDCFKDKFIIAVGKTEWADLKWTDASIASKKSIINSADIVFTAAKSVSDFDNAKAQLKTQGVNDLLLDCSDAHYFSDNSDKDRIGNCNTWIKADPSFDGLKQVLIEPNERVFVGEEPDIHNRVRNHKTKYLRNINVNQVVGYKKQYGEWFNDVNVELNKELVAIIGNKGSGKSALADIMALCGNFKNHDSFSFLNKKKFRKGNISKNFESILTWESGNTDTRNLSDEPKENQFINVKYLPQGDFENLTNEIGKAEEFQKEIEKVVFSHLGDDDKLTFKNFEEVIESKKNIAEKEIKIVKDKIGLINADIIKLEKKLNPKYKASIEGVIKQKEEELAALLKPKEVKNPNAGNNPNQQNEESLLKLTVIKEKISSISSNIESKKQVKQKLLIEIQKLNSFKDEVSLKSSEIKQYQEDNRELLKIYDIRIEDVISLETDFSVINSILLKKKGELELIYKTLGETEDKPNENTLNYQLNTQEKLLKQEQGKLDESQKEYQKYLKEKIDWLAKRKEIEGDENKPNTLKSLKKELDYLENQLVPDISNNSEKRLEYINQVFSSKEKIVEIYKDVKNKIDSKIEENKDLLEGYKINIDASLILKSDFKNKFSAFISFNKGGSFYGKEGGEIQLLKILEGKDFNKVEDVKELLKTIIEYFKVDNRDNQNNVDRYIDDQINNLSEFYDYIFSLDYLDFNYKLKLGEKHIEQLSPGERGALLLVFYLLLDKNDIPLILDQPEDNLDNHSVANVLVPFIRKAKRKRQIILVTHNPNLAVVADAEQIIWVDIDKENNKFHFISGSIENREINKRIVNVLEGAMPAFNKRKQKYYE